MSRPRDPEDLKRGWWNITDEIIDFASKLKLDAIATGGGVDYIGVQLDNGMWAVVGSAEDAGSPDRLSEPANINIFLDEEWNRFIVIEFRSAKLALEHLAVTHSIN